MNRRELIKRLGMASGVGLFGIDFILSGCNNPNPGTQTIDEVLPLLQDISEVIVPETDTVGAKSTKCAEFILDKIYKDIYTDEEQTKFKKILLDIDNQANTQYRESFINLGKEEKLAIIQEWDTKRDKENKPNEEFYNLKGIIVFAYVSSEQGCKATYRYTPIPGKYEAIIDYKMGEKAFTGLG